MLKYLMVAAILGSLAWFAASSAVDSVTQSVNARAELLANY